jgi:transcriptional regulator with XRE-family HTH domain
VKNATGIAAFGRHLRQLREARKLSQQALADYADIAKPTVQRIEKGQAAATLEVLLSLARALHVPFRELMDAPDIDPQ